MNKLEQITTFLTELNLVSVEQIDTWAEEPKIVPSGRVVSSESIVLYRQVYTGVISISNYPHDKHAPELLFSHVCAWLINNNSSDEYDEIAHPTIDVNVSTDRLADVEIRIAFDENITAVKDSSGVIKLNGSSWRLSEVRLDYAEEGELLS